MIDVDLGADYLEEFQPGEKLYRYRIHTFVFKKNAITILARHEFSPGIKFPLRQEPTEMKFSTWGEIKN